MMWDQPIPSYTDLIDFALDLYKEQGVQLDSSFALPALSRIFASRYEAMLPDVRHDVLDAALLDEATQETCMPRRVRLRIRCLDTLVKDPEFVQTATRPLNIVSAARRKQVPFAEENPLAAVDKDALQSETGFALLQALKLREDEVSRAVSEERAEDVVSLLRAMERPINDFFEATMVMAEDENVRFARLSLMNACSIQLLAAGDFSKLVFPGQGAFAE
jgi:glycyl-tRNA synthetase beta chain